MLQSLLIANRGEIARRIIRTARRMGIRTIAVVTAADRSWPHWREADQFVAIGEGPPAESYLSIERIIGAAVKTGAEAIHPGYGFLSENAAFAEAVVAAGLVFVGPPAEAIRAMGSKAEAKQLMALAGVPVVPGYGGERQEPYFLKQKAYEIGYPVLIKAVAGGGGRGMRLVTRALDFDAALDSAKREALSAFGDEQVLVERYLVTPRHIEVQIFADSHGNAVHLFERDCSVQRRHQKMIEEAPAPGVRDDMRAALGAAAVKAATAVGYRGAGTVEFIADQSKPLGPDNFFFIEMNTRLQVEHPVTEAVTGLDLVEWQLRVAAGEALPHSQDQIALKGHAVEARIYAEDPADDFRPSMGRLAKAAFPTAPGIRVDSGVEQGTIVGSDYDALLAKVIASGADRAEALGRLERALARTRIAGPKTNLAFLCAIVGSETFRAGGVDTTFVDRALPDLIGPPPDLGLVAGAVAEWAERTGKAEGALATGPWARTDSFQLSGLSRTSTLALEVEGAPVTAELAWTKDGPLVVSVGGSPPERGEGTEIVWDGPEAFLLDRGRQLRVTFPDPLMRRADQEPASGDVTAPITGRIVALGAAVGARVAKGDVLFSIEAMKMEHGVAAPLAGIVRSVKVAPGQQVEEGAIAVVIDAFPEGEGAREAGG